MQCLQPRDCQSKKANPPYRSKVTPLKLSLDIGPSSSTDITCAWCGYLRGGSVYVASFRFKAKERLQRCGDVFFGILITSKGASALGMF